jgi:hypothetical protein
MIVVVCMPCARAVRIMPSVVSESNSVDELNQLVGSRSEFWPNKYPCPWCGKNATGMLEREADSRVLSAMNLQDASPQEAFAAFNGFGFPEEQQCSLEAMQELLREQPVRKVIGTNVSGMERTIIDHLELWDGTKVYFGSAAEGAVIYRTTRPFSYTEKVLKETTG